MSATNADQRDYWSDQAGPTWVAEQAQMDALLAPVLDAVLERAAITPGEAVLDIGCGAGSSTLAAGAATGPQGRAVGLDISPTLLALAQSRAKATPHIGFVRADAQVHRFDAPFDVLISRFGVMFFEDFTAAFRNMALALRPGGRMVFATWGPIPDNPFFVTPAMVAKEVLGPVPKSDPDAPGPFALRERELILRILAATELCDAAVEEVAINLTPKGDAQATADLMCRIGPAQSALTHHQADDAARASLRAALAEALAAFDGPKGLHVPARLNLVRARKPA